MLRLLDSWSTDVIVWPPREVPVRIVVACPAGLMTLREVRAALVGDLTRRVLQDRYGFEVRVSLALPSERDGGGVRRVLSSLRVASLAEAGDADRPAHLAVDAGRPGPGETARLSVGPVMPVSATLATLAGGRHDRLAIRFALLSARHDRPVSLGPTRLRSVARTLRRWRRRVAGWAAHPPAEMPQDILEHANAAVDDNLNITKMLSVLTRLERDLTVLPGAKLETFLHLDRILALDLVRGLAGTARDVLPE